MAEEQSGTKDTKETKDSKEVKALKFEARSVLGWFKRRYVSVE